jgi:single-strand DNA-binding protein
MNLNRHDLIGRVGKDPIISRVGNGSTMAKMSVATSYGYKNKEGEWVNETDWHNITMFGKTADACSNLMVKKGDLVYISGRHKMRTTKSEDGEYRLFSDIITETLIKLTPKDFSSDNDDDSTPF